VWLSYKAVNKLLGNGECMVGVDYKPEPPPDDDEDDGGTSAVTVIVDGKEYGGTLERVK